MMNETTNKDTAAEERLLQNDEEEQQQQQQTLHTTVVAKDPTSPRGRWVGLVLISLNVLLGLAGYFVTTKRAPMMPNRHIVEGGTSNTHTITVDKTSLHEIGESITVSWESHGDEDEKGPSLTGSDTIALCCPSDAPHGLFVEAVTLAEVESQNEWFIEEFPTAQALSTLEPTDESTGLSSTTTCQFRLYRWANNEPQPLPSSPDVTVST